MHWFTDMVFRWRSGAAVVWVCALSCPALILYQLLALFNPLHPLTWLQVWLSSVFSLRSVVFGSLYILTLSLSCITYPLTYTVTLPVYRSRLSVICAVLRPSRLLVVASYMLLGGGASYCLAELASYHHLWYPYNSYPHCLNEYLFFHFLHGLFMGLRYGMGYYLEKDHFLVFPIIQQHKLFRLRGHVISHVREGLLWTLRGVRYYYPLYFLFGYYPRNRLIHTLGLQLRDDIRLTSLSSLIDVGLLMSLLVTGTTMHVGWGFGLRIFRTFQTEGIQFPVVATFAGERGRTLTDAMSCRSCPLVQCLGFLDFHQLALHSHARRAQVFSLDYNGKPAVWEEVSRECVTLIRGLALRLRRASNEGTALSTSPPSTASPITPPHLTNGGSPSLLSGKGWPELPVGVLAPPGVGRRVASTEKTRLWSYSPGAMGAPPVTSQTATPQSSQDSDPVVQRVTGDVKDSVEQFRDKIRRKPFFEYFLSELPGVAEQVKFVDSQLQIWAITGISELAVRSYTEDQYGVVQRTLPDILRALIGLSKELDKCVKAPLSNSKSTRNVRRALETNGKYAVKTAAQMSLHRLAVTFTNEMRSLQLSEEQITYWNQFMGMRQEQGL